MPTKGGHHGVCLSPVGIEAITRQLDLRAWYPGDWAVAAGVHPKTAQAWLRGAYINKRSAEKLRQALRDHKAIPGMSGFLKAEVAS